MSTVLDLPATPTILLEVQPQRWFRLIMMLIRDSRCADDDEIKGIELVVVHPKVPQRWARRWVSVNNVRAANGVICVAREINEDGEMIGSFAFEPDHDRRGGVIENTDERYFANHGGDVAEGGAE